MPRVLAKIDNELSQEQTVIDICSHMQQERKCISLIADRITALRKSRGWTQAELARKLCVTRNGVNSWEQGLSMPSPTYLVELAKVFSVSTDYLLGIENLCSINVTGLCENDVVILAELADRLKKAI